jgi:hypothetical protein
MYGSCDVQRNKYQIYNQKYDIHNLCNERKHLHAVTHSRRMYYYCLLDGIVQGVSYTASITDLLCFPICVLIISDTPPDLSDSNHYIHRAATQELTWWEMSMHLAYKYLFSYRRDLLTCRKILRHGTDGYTYPLKEVVIQSFIDIKNPLSSAGSEPTNLGSNGKDSNY